MEMQIRFEGMKVPDGWSITNCSYEGGRVHVIYQETDGDIVRRFRFAFSEMSARQIQQALTLFEVEVYNRTTEELTSVWSSTNTNSPRSGPQTESSSGA